MNKRRDCLPDEELLYARTRQILSALRVEPGNGAIRLALLVPRCKYGPPGMLEDCVLGIIAKNHVLASVDEIMDLIVLARRFYPNKFDRACARLARDVTARTLEARLRPIYVKQALYYELPMPIADEICEHLTVYSSR